MQAKGAAAVKIDTCFTQMARGGFVKTGGGELLLFSKRVGAGSWGSETEGQELWRLVQTVIARNQAADRVIRRLGNVALRRNAGGVESKRARRGGNGSMLPPPHALTSTGPASGVASERARTPFLPFPEEQPWPLARDTLGLAP